VLHSGVPKQEQLFRRRHEAGLPLFVIVGHPLPTYPTYSFPYFDLSAEPAWLKSQSLGPPTGIAAHSNRIALPAEPIFFRSIEK
jgi:hypothetical protein